MQSMDEHMQPDSQNVLAGLRNDENRKTYEAIAEIYAGDEPGEDDRTVESSLLADCEERVFLRSDVVLASIALNSTRWDLLPRLVERGVTAYAVLATRS